MMPHDLRSSRVQWLPEARGVVSVLHRAATVLGLALASVGLGLIAYGALHRLIVRAPTGWAGIAGLELLALGLVFITLSTMLHPRAQALWSSTCRRATQALGRTRLHVLSVLPGLIPSSRWFYKRALVLPGLIPSRRSPHKRAIVPREVFRAVARRWHSTASLLSVRVTLGLFFASLFLLYLCFAYNEDCLLHDMDGTAWIVLFQAEELGRHPFAQTGVDPFQGNFDAFYPTYREYLLPSALALATGDALSGKTATYLIYAALLMIGSYVVARTVQIDRAPALLGSFLLPLLAFPSFYHRLAQFFPLFELNPHLSQAVSMSLFSIAAMWALGNKRPIQSIFLIATPALCIMLVLLSEMLAVVLMIPALVLYGGGALLGVRGVRDVFPFIFAGLIAIAIPLAVGIGEYAHGLIQYSAYFFFSKEFVQTRASLQFVSTLFWPTPFGILGVGLGVVGAIWTVLAKRGRVQLFALTHLIATLLFFVVGISIVLFASGYQGPSPLYFEVCFWPFMLMFSAVAILEAARAVGMFGAFLFGRTVTFLSQHSAPIVIVAVMLSVLGFNRVAAVTDTENICQMAGFTPIQNTPITDILHKEIAIEPGKAFRGLVATINGVDGRAAVDWQQLRDSDRVLWGKTGNDYRSVGLWWFKIPTLFHYSTVMTAPFYLLLTEFLSRPSDGQFRSAITLTHPDEKMMPLWGVRFLISDTEIGWAKEVVEQRVSDSQSIRLYEIPDANIEGYSPTRVQHMVDFAGGLRALHAPDFDGRNTVVTEAELGEPLVPASGSRIVYRKDGLQLHAESTRTSVLVLPVQYSHCWRAEGDGAPELFRANLMQLGVRFKGELNARLIFRYGPIRAGACRLRDVNDMVRLHISEARERGKR
jgi:hypothetical protein